MQRREFLGVLGGAAVAWPHAMHAQVAGRIYRLGIMTPSLKIAASPIAAFFDELRVFGFVEGQNLKVDGGGYGLHDEQLLVHPPALTEGVICRRALECRRHLLPSSRSQRSPVRSPGSSKAENICSH
jgi:hypothetical protein